MNKIRFIRTDVFSPVVGGNIAHGRGVVKGFIENNWDVECYVPIHLKDVLGCTKGEGYKSFRGWIGEVLFNRYVFGKLKDKSGIFYIRFSGFSDIGYRLKSDNNFIILEYNSSACWVMKNWVKKNMYTELLRLFVCRNEERVLRSADLIIVVSDVLKDVLVKKGVQENKILVNPNGVDTEMFSPDVKGDVIRRKYRIGDDKILIGFVGTFGPWHGAENLAKAYSVLLSTNPDYAKSTMLMLVGDGVRMPVVKEIIRKENIEDNVVITGIVPYKRIPQYLAACDVLVAPHVPNPDGSRFFGSPTKLFEYMAMEKPIVASNLDQIGEILKDDYSAVMVKPGDVVDLAEGIKRIVNMTKEERLYLGRNARKEVVEKYTWNKHVRRIIDRIKERYLKC